MANKCFSLDNGKAVLLQIFAKAALLPPTKAATTLPKVLHLLAVNTSVDDHQELIELAKKFSEQLGLAHVLGDISYYFRKRGVDMEALTSKIEQRIYDRVTYDDIIERRGEVRKQILSKYFGQLKNATNYYLRQSKQLLLNSFIVDRENKRFILEKDLTNSIKNLKQKLLNLVISYIQKYESKNEDLIKIIEDSGVNLFNEEGYTQILALNSDLRKLIEKIFPIEVISTRPAFLEEMYKQMKKNQDELAKDYLEAYNSWALLNDFDVSVALILSDLVEIDPTSFNKIENSEYRLNLDKATNMWSFGIGDENADIKDIISTSTQLLIESTRRYNWKGEVIPDSYIRFLDYNYTIGKIKSLLYLIQKEDIKIDGTIQDAEGNVKKVISTTTEEVLKSIERLNRNNGEKDVTPTLFQLIAYMSEDPQKVLHAIFDVLCNTNVMNSNVCRQYFDDLDKSYIWSLYKEIFGTFDSEDTRSLFDLHHNTYGDTIFGIITQISDSTFAEEFLLYFEEEDGTFSVQMLKNYAVLILKSLTQKQIQEVFGVCNPEQFKKIVQRNKIKINRTTPSITDSKYQYQGKEVQLTYINSINIPIIINNTTVANITANPDGTVKVEKVNLDINYETIWKSIEFRELIDNLIGFNFEYDVDLAKSYENLFVAQRGLRSIVDYDALINDISRIIGISTLNQVFNNDIVPTALTISNSLRKISTIESIIAKQWPNVGDRPKINKETGVILLIPNKLKSVVLEKISKAQAVNSGTFAAAQVKTGEGTALANFCLSRLRNSYPYQILTQNRARNSASRNTTFVTNKNGLYEGIVTSRELKVKDKTKPNTEFNPVESFTISFISDWVGAFCPKHFSSSPVGDGHVLFLPTVNSDKSQIDKLKCNLNAETHWYVSKDGRLGIYTNEDEYNFVKNDIAKHLTYAELSESQIEQEMRIEFGPMYSKIISNINTELQRVINILQIQETSTSSDPLGIWEDNLNILTNYFKNIGEKPADGLFRVTQAYNKTHTRNPIQLAPEIHFIKNGSNLEINKSLAALYGRYSIKPDSPIQNKIKKLYLSESLDGDIRKILGDTYRGDIELLDNLQLDIIRNFNGKDAEGNTINGASIYKSITKALQDRKCFSVEGFFLQKDVQSVLLLLKGGFKLYLTGNFSKNQPEYKKLAELDRGTWVTASGMMALAKIGPDKHPTNNIGEIEKAYRNGELVIIHPMLSKLNRMDYLTTQQYICSVGGAHYVYKGRGATVLEEEAARWLASNKRNVCYASTVHKFQNNVLNGAPSTYNYAIIDDIDAALYNIMGELHTHAPIDGGMLVNGYMPELENNSLGGERVGLDKKHFATMYFEDLAAGSITKTAGFAATNSRMMRSWGWRVLQENMSNRPWLKEYASAEGDIKETLDITRDFDGRIIDWASKGVYYTREESDGTIHLYQLTDVRSLGNNNYEIKEQEIDREGNALGDSHTRINLTTDENGNPISLNYFTIDTNWKLFTNIFGGYHSLDFNSDGYLDFSEKSRSLMVEAINKIGYYKHSDNKYIAVNKYGEQFEAYADRDPELVENSGKEPNLSDVWQPLKYSDVHFCPNIGAIKSALMNVNPSKAMSEKFDLNIMIVKMALMGVQLDKEHHADAAEVSMPTQIILACANKGYTLEVSSELYVALSNLTEIAIEDCMEGIMDVLPEGEHKGLLLAKIAQIIVEKLIHGSDDNDALHAVMQHLEDKVKAGYKLTPEDVNGTTAWSDSSTYNKIYSDLASHLTNQAIKMKFSGSLSVICPTHLLEKLYGDRRLNSFTKLIPGAPGEALAMAQYQKEVLEDKSLDIDNMPRNKSLVYDFERDFIGANENDLIQRKLNVASLIETLHIYNIEYDDGSTETIEVNYPQLYEYIKQLLIKFTEVSSEMSPTSLGHTKNNGNIVITSSENINPAVFYDYIEGKVESATSALKKAVFEQLASLNFTIEALYLLLGVDSNKIKQFLLFHELSHKENNDAANYPRNPDGSLDLMNPKAIAIEARATKDAWLKMLTIAEAETNPEVEEKAKEYLKEVRIVKKVYENVTKGRELSAYNVRFCDTKGNYYNIYDIDSVRLLFTVVNDSMDAKVPYIDSIKLFGKNHFLSLEKIDKFINSEVLLRYSKNDIESYMLRILQNNNTSVYEGYVSAENKENFKLYNESAFILAYKDAVKLILRKLLQQDLFKLSKSYSGDRGLICNGRAVTIDFKTIKTKAYELIMPKVYKTVFGLKEFDDVAEILKDPDFFTKRAITKYKSKLTDSLYDYELKRFSGEHVYIIDSRNGVPVNLERCNGFKPFKEKDGTWSRVNMDGEVIYPISSEQDYTVYSPDRKIEIIVTDHPEFYMENLRYNAIAFSNSRVSEDLITNLVHSTHNIKDTKLFFRTFTNKNGQIKDFSRLKKRNTNLERLSLEKGTDEEVNKLIDDFYKEGREIFSSFNKSLDVIAGRIPAQSQQSFMPQRVVAFDSSNINTAMVSTFQLFLQGSDLKYLLFIHNASILYPLLFKRHKQC